MSKPFDYSKWDNIELSDDEDDVHPNIDKESWFRLKHRSRVEREQAEEADKARIRQEVCVLCVRVGEEYIQGDLISLLKTRVVVFIVSKLDGQGRSTHQSVGA